MVCHKGSGNVLVAMSECTHCFWFFITKLSTLFVFRQWANTFVVGEVGHLPCKPLGQPIKAPAQTILSPEPTT